MLFQLIQHPLITAPAECPSLTRDLSMPALSNPRHEAFAQALARGEPAVKAYVEAGYKSNSGNPSVLKRDQRVSKRVDELQEAQLAIHQQATAEAAANAKVTYESLIAEAEAARVKAMAEKGGAAAAVSATTVKAKLAGMWRDKVDQHNTGTPAYERIERVIVERAPVEEPLPPPSYEDRFEDTPARPTSPARHWSS
jgi:hypothetical protein